ncbi:MAG: hypothetical protein RIC87_00015 [Kiloniellales bacterium]
MLRSVTAKQHQQKALPIAEIAAEIFVGSDQDQRTAVAVAPHHHNLEDIDSHRLGECGCHSTAPLTLSFQAFSIDSDGGLTLNRSGQNGRQRLACGYRGFALDFLCTSGS